MIIGAQLQQGLAGKLVVPPRISTLKTNIFNFFFLLGMVLGREHGWKLWFIND